MVELDRKTFLGGLAATFGGMVSPVVAFGVDAEALISFGVASDIHLVVKRQSLVWDESLGSDWTIPVPVRPGGGYDFLRCAAMRPAPQFAPTAKAVAELCAKEPASTGPGRDCYGVADIALAGNMIRLD